MFSNAWYSQPSDFSQRILFIKTCRKGDHNPQWFNSKPAETFKTLRWLSFYKTFGVGIKSDKREMTQMIKILSLNFELSCVSQRMFVASLSGSILARVALSMRQEKSGFFTFFLYRLGVSLSACLIIGIHAGVFVTIFRSLWRMEVYIYRVVVLF